MVSPPKNLCDPLNCTPFRVFQKVSDKIAGLFLTDFIRRRLLRDFCVYGVPMISPGSGPDMLRRNSPKRHKSTFVPFAGSRNWYFRPATSCILARCKTVVYARFQTGAPTVYHKQNRIASTFFRKINVLWHGNISLAKLTRYSARFIYYNVYQLLNAKFKV